MRKLKDAGFQINIKIKNLRKSKTANDIGQHTYYGTLYMNNVDIGKVDYLAQSVDMAMYSIKTDIWMLILKKFRKR